MAIITDRVLEGAYQVVIRWYVVGSQRYPADQNEYFSTYFEQLEPGQEFPLEDSRFVLSEINEDEADIQYVIRDFCHIQSLIPQFTDLDYIQADRAPNTFLSADAAEDATTIEVDDATLLATNLQIQIGLLQWDTRVITGISGTTITLDRPLDRNYASGTEVANANILMNYPDGDPSLTIARIFDTDGATLADPVIVQHPLFFDTSETVKRYFYTAVLERPFNGARGSGETVNQTITHNGQQIEAGWWAVGDVDNDPANRAALITADGTVIAVRDGRYAFEIDLSYSSAGESSACTELTTKTYFGNHSLFKNDGFTDFINEDGTRPPEGYYSWTSTIPSDLNERFVKYWDGFAFLEGVVNTGFVDNCPGQVGNNTSATLYSTAQDLACRTNGTSTTLYYEGSSFSSGNVTAIYTDPYGPASDVPSALGTTFIHAGGNNLIWAPPNLSPEPATCATNFCLDPGALNTGLSLPCIYPDPVCGDPNANNYVANPTTTQLVDQSVCQYDGFTATLITDTTSVSSTGSKASSDFTVVSNSPQGGSNGDTVNLNARVLLSPGFNWINQPADYSNDVTFAGADITENHSFSGLYEPLMTAVPGCNTSTAENYVAGSDGSVECFTSIGDFYKSLSDTFACAAVTIGTASTVRLVSSSEDSRVREWDPVSMTTIQGASGWYANDGGFQYYQNGNLVDSGSCALPGLTGLVINSVSSGAYQPGPGGFTINFSVLGYQLPPGAQITGLAVSLDPTEAFIGAPGYSHYISHLGDQSNGFDETITVTGKTLGTPLPDSYTITVSAGIVGSDFGFGVTGNFVVDLSDIS